MILHGFTSFFNVLNIKISYMLLVVLLVTVPSISQISADKSFHYVGQVFAPVDTFYFPGSHWSVSPAQLLSVPREVGKVVEARESP